MEMAKQPNDLARGAAVACLLPFCTAQAIPRQILPPIHRIVRHTIGTEKKAAKKTGIRNLKAKKVSDKKSGAVKGGLLRIHR
jgi:hypothetical protein